MIWVSNKWKRGASIDEATALYLEELRNAKIVEIVFRLKEECVSDEAGVFRKNNSAVCVKGDKYPARQEIQDHHKYPARQEIQYHHYQGMQDHPTQESKGDVDLSKMYQDVLYKDKAHVSPLSSISGVKENIQDVLYKDKAHVSALSSISGVKENIQDLFLLKDKADKYPHQEIKGDKYPSITLKELSQDKTGVPVLKYISGVHENIEKKVKICSMRTCRKKLRFRPSYLPYAEPFQ